MLTLAGSFRVGANTIFRDVLYRDGERSLNANFYVLPDAPRIARDDSGGPAFRFLWYRALGSGDGSPPQVRAGGMLTVTVDLASDADGLADLRAGIASAAGLDSPEAVQILPIPFKAGAVTLSFAGQNGGAGDLAVHIAGNGPASLVGAEQAAFAIELTSDGGAMLAKAITAGLDILSVTYDLVFEYRLDAIKLRMWCDVRAAHDLAAARLAAGPLKSTELRELLTARAIAGIDITADTEIAADQRTTLENMANKLLDDALRQALFGFAMSAPGDNTDGSAGDTVDASQLRPCDESSQTIVNHSFAESYPAEQHAVTSAVLKLAATPDELATRMLQVDVSDAMSPLEVKVICPVDFADGLIGAVHVFLEHGGDPVQAGDFVFKQGATEWTFRANATPGQRNCRQRATVYYKNGTTADLEPATFDTNLMVIDADALGVLDTTVTLGDVPLSIVRSVPVALEYPAKGLATTVVLDGANPSAGWRAVIGAREVGTYRYRASWLTADAGRIDDEWRVGCGRLVFLDAPRGLGATATVEAIGAGDFNSLAQIVLDLRLAPESTGADAAQFTFTGAGQTHQWRPRQSAPGAGLSYQARRTLVGPDGIVQVLEWTAETSPVLVVRDMLRFTVQIVARLLDLGGASTLALLDLEYIGDPAATPQQQSLVLRDKSAEPQWSFRIAASDRHRYRYRLTMIARDGTRRAAPWIEAEAEVLVLQP